MKWTLIAFVALVLGTLLIAGCGSEETTVDEDASIGDLPLPPNPPTIGNESFPPTGGVPLVREGTGGG